ncbi:hypothetical protein DFH07DRAFT_770485 [Mycena maculata]|uniref:Uncharacterized protein n=1 Tax=Mycena maculata TaxID=230809 RepID=A0AAD7JKV8_9AGAR|nr:hypothetical protein DFH07DRAFT_770485 [Mycena maculata]
MENRDKNNQPPNADYTGATRPELLEALKASQKENTHLRAENHTLREEISTLSASSSKKRRGQTDDRLGYKSQVVSWSKRFLFTRALFIDTSMFSTKPSETVSDPATIFSTDDLYTEFLTVALYQGIPDKFHELLDFNKYSNLAKDFIREHGDARSSLIFTLRKTLPNILKGLDIDFDLLTTASADRRDNPVLWGLLKFPTDTKPTPYAPVLFPGPTQNMTELFLSPAVKKVHRLMYFGPGSLAIGGKPAANSNGVRLGLKMVTESSISAAAIRSGNRTIAPTKNCFLQTPTFRTSKTIHDYVFAGLKISSSDATGDDGTEDAIVDAMRRFELGDSAAPDITNSIDDTLGHVDADNLNAVPAPAPAAAVEVDIPNEAEVGCVAATRQSGRRGGGSREAATGQAASSVAPRTTRSRR